MIEVLKAGLPCNLNFINNIAICDFLKESDFLQTLVIDPLGNYEKFLRFRFGNNLLVDRYYKNENSKDLISRAIIEGLPILLVDIDAELLQ